MKQTVKVIEDELKKIYRVQGENLVNNKKEWSNYVDTLDYKSTDILYTLICLQKLTESNATHDELYNFLYNLKPSVKKVNIEYPILKAAKLSIYGEKLLEEVTDLYGEIETKEELNKLLLKQSKRKKIYRKR